MVGSYDKLIMECVNGEKNSSFVLRLSSIIVSFSTTPILVSGTSISFGSCDNSSSIRFVGPTFLLFHFVVDDEAQSRVAVAADNH